MSPLVNTRMCQPVEVQGFWKSSVVGGLEEVSIPVPEVCGLGFL
jgi:hypothetical protein